MKIKKTVLALILLLFVVPQYASSVAFRPSREGILVPILMYHQVKPNKLGKDVISPQELDGDLQYLKANGYHTITMSQLIDYVYDGIPLPANPIILSFDDGYLNNYIYAFPLLKKYDMKIVLSVIGKNIDDFTNHPDGNIDYSHANWAQINDMIASGLVDIQNHTYDMHKQNGRYGCGQMKGESPEHYRQALQEDILGFQNELMEKAGVLPNTFTYPYGTISESTDTILKEFGFKATLSCKYGVNAVTRDPDCLFDLKRICRSHGCTAQKLIGEAMKTIH